MLLKDSGQRAFPADLQSGKLRFGHSVFKVYKEWRITWSQFHKRVGKGTQSETESHVAYRPITSLDVVVTDMGKVTNTIAVAVQKIKWSPSAGEFWRTRPR